MKGMVMSLELVFNLWAIYDSSTRVVMRYPVKDIILKVLMKTS
jgi:hypothetical protein